jgi:hypothetical protein
MNQTDPRAQAAFDAAMNHIKTTTAGVADRVSDHLGLLASAAARIFDRDALVNAQLDLRRHMSTFVLVFADTLSKKVTRELNPGHEPGRSLAETDWQSLSLVDDSEVEERMFADRISQAITHACEWYRARRSRPQPAASRGAGCRDLPRHLRRLERPRESQAARARARYGHGTGDAWLLFRHSERLPRPRRPARRAHRSWGRGPGQRHDARPGHLGLRHSVTGSGHAQRR